MIIAKLAFIYLKKLNSFYSLFNSMSHSCHFSECFILKCMLRLHTFSPFTFIYPDSGSSHTHAECISVQYLPDLSWLWFLACRLFCRRWLRGRQVSRERSRGYGRQFGNAFSLCFSIWAAVCRSISSIYLTWRLRRGNVEWVNKKKKKIARCFPLYDVLTFAGSN